MHLEYARQFDKILSTDGFFTRNCVAAAESKYPDHFAEAAEAEAIATTIREYAPLLIPGLLQTEAYARAMFRAGHPTAPRSHRRPRSCSTGARQLLGDPTRPMFGQ